MGVRGGPFEPKASDPSPALGPAGVGSTPSEHQKEVGEARGRQLPCWEGSWPWAWACPRGERN